MATLLCLVFLIFFKKIIAERCLQTLGNEKDYIGALRNPGRIQKWNSAIKSFEFFEAVTSNGSQICTVDYLDDIRGHKIEVAVDAIHPYVLPDPTYTNITGYIGDIWSILERTLKFTSVFKKAGRSAGSDLLSGGFGIWLGATTIQLHAQGHYSYTHQIARTSYSLFAMSEGTHVSNYWYTMIFSKSLWLTTFFFLLTVAGFLLAMYKLKKIFCRNYKEYHDEFSGVSFILIFVLGGVTGQGIQTIPSSWSLRILIITALLMGAVISCGFSSTLTSFLAIRGRRLPLTGLEDVAMKRTHSLCVRNDSGAYVNLTTSLILGAPLRAEWEGIVNTKRCPDMKDTKNLGAKLCNPGVVFLEAPDVFLSVYRQVKHRCDIVQLNGDYWPLKISFLYARSSRVQLIINKYLVRLHSAGILKYLEKKWISRELPDSTAHKFSFKPVEHAHIQFIFLGLCLFMPISALICIIENIWYHLSMQFKINLKVKQRKRHLKILKTIGFPVKYNSRRYKFFIKARGIEL